MKRDLVAVIEEVKDNISPIFINAHSLRVELGLLQLEARKTDIRIDGHQKLWHKGAGILSEFLGELDCPWKKKVYAIWAKRR